MTELTKQDLTDAFADALKSTGFSGGMAKANNWNTPSNTTAAKQARADAEHLKKSTEYNRHLGSIVSNATKFDKELDNMAREATNTVSSFKQIAATSSSLAAGLSVAATVIGALASSIKDSVKEYREMANVGRTFSGSMMKMQIAAAEAALPLEEFSRLVQQNSKVIAGLGVTAFTDLGKSLRKNLHQFGMLGLTTENLNDYLGEYMETQRLYGGLQHTNSVRAVSSMEQLAIQTSRMSELTGKNRLEIMRQSQQAMRDDSVKSKMMMLTVDQQERFGKQMLTATTYLSALPGQAGETLTRMLTQTVGRGSALLSDDMQGFVEAGMFGVTELMDGLRRKIETGRLGEGDMETFRTQLMSQSKQGMSTLKFLADTGNESARKAINLISEMSSLDGKKLKEIDQMNKTMKFYLNFGDQMKMLSGWLRERFLKAFESVANTFQKFVDGGGLQKIAAVFGGMIDKFAGWLDNFINSGMLELAAEKFANFVGYAVDAFGGVVKVALWLGEAFGTVADHVGGAANALGLFVGSIAAAKVAMAVYGRGRGETLVPTMADQVLQAASAGGSIRVTVTNPGDMGGGDGGRRRSRRGGRRPGGTRGAPPGGGAPRGGVLGKIKNIASAATGAIASKAPGVLGGAKALATRSAPLLAAMALQSANNNLLPDYTGKGFSNVGLGILGGAATGMAAGPWGALAGALGGGGMALYENWDSITGDISKIFSSSETPKPTQTVAPVTPVPVATPMVDPVVVNQQIKTLQSNYEAVLSENKELRKMIEGLKTTMEDTNSVLRSGFIETINQNKKGNRDLGNIAGNLG